MQEAEDCCLIARLRDLIRSHEISLSNEGQSSSISERNVAISKVILDSSALVATTRGTIF